MEWSEQIIAGLRSVLDRPDVLWSGLGTEVVFTLLGLAGAGALWLIARLFRKKTASDRHDAGDWLAKNRHKLLARLQWELDERNKSLLLGQTTLHLDKDLSPDEVNHPHTRQDSLDYTLERDGKAVETTDQPIVDLFLRPDVGQRLAILGKPGSGKTVCLLKLLEHLLERAEGYAHEPLPIIFECSEWDGRELVPWMAYQLHRKYEIQEDTARQMVESRDILPLFDGLDELATEKQGDFVRRFNALPNDRPQIVCCRIKEYEYLQENAGDKLALRNAVILRDIAPQRLKGHLLRAGLHDLWMLLEQPDNEADPSSLQPAEEGQDGKQPQTLLELAQRPLFLGIMIAVAEKLRQGWKRQPGETWEDLLWRLYLNDCLVQRPPQPKQEPDAHDRKYAEAPSRHWLHCLARWMQKENKVALQIDELQPTMLKGYWRFILSYGLVISLFFVLAGELFIIPMLKYIPRWIDLLVFGPVYGLAIGLSILLIMGIERIKIDPLRPLHLPTSCQDVRAFSIKLAIWLFVCPALGLILGLSVNLMQMRWIDLGARLALGLFFFIALGLLIGLAQGLKAVAGPIRKTAWPQQRINESLINSLVLLPLFVLAALLLFVQLLFLVEKLGIATGKLFDMHRFYMNFFLFTILSFIALDTNAVLQHYLLRLCLHREGQLPLRFVPWLEVMRQRKVLQRVGGSYHFLHKQLQEYLAKQQAL